MFVTPFCRASGFAPGGGDGDVAVNNPDPSNANTPNLAVVSLSAAEVTGSHSTKRADAFSTPNPATAGVPFDDRMWLDGVNDASHVYMEYHDFGTTSQIFVQRSSDGGETYSGALGAAVDAATEPSVGPPTGNIAGQIKVDNSSCASHGNLFPGLAVDNFGYIYAAWSDNTDVYYSFSTNHGTRWSPAIKVTRNTSQAGKSTVFPWIAADGNGHVAIAWYGADQAGNSNTVPAASTHWNVFVAESVRGHAISPVFAFSQATDHSNHTGQISTGGLLGSSDRSLADFFQIGMDPNHLVNIAYADNHAGPSVTYFTQQRTATAGIAITGKCAGTSHEAAGSGHLNGKHGGQAQFSFNYDDSNQPTGSVSFSDSGSGINFQSTQVTAAAFDDVAHTAT
jgi:hypothetical protein